MKKFFSILTLLVAAAMFASPANAAVSISLSTTGFGSLTTVSSSGGSTTAYSNANYNGSGFAISTVDVSTLTLGPHFSETTGATTSITYNGTGSATLWIGLSGTGFMTPTTPPNLLMESNFSSTTGLLKGTGNGLTFQSFVNTGNTDALSGITTGTQIIGQSGKTFPSNNASLLITSLTTVPYALNEGFAITLNHGSTFNFSTTTSLASVPEPATMTLWGIGLAVCGLAARRRRNAKAA